MKKLCALVCLSLIINYSGVAQEVSRRDSLVADFTYLVKLLEDSHPDPYTHFGGKVFFHEQAALLKDELGAKDYTVSEFADKVSEFLANLQDGHTYVSLPQSSVRDLKRYLPLQMRVIPDGLILSGLPDEYKELLGSRVERINDCSVDQLLKRTAAIEASENVFGSYAHLAASFSHPDINTKLFPEPQENVNLTVETADGEKRTFVLPFIGREEWLNREWAKLPEWEKIPAGNYLSYNFLDERKEVMFFKLTSVMARENFEYVLDRRWPGAYDQLKSFYDWTLKKEMPADTLAALAGVPSLSEEFYNLLSEMKRHKSKALIIDLRLNGGGWTPITLPVLYQLYGDAYLKTDMEAVTYKYVSDLYLKKQNISLERLNKMYRGSYALGDYIKVKNAVCDTCDIRSLRQRFIDQSMCSNRDVLTQQEGQPIYHPGKIYVLTDEWTFSAAFHFAFYLWKMGATVVGVPSMQAPNTYMEQTPFRLPATQLEGSISNSLQLFLPVNDRRANIFWPDIMLTYPDYQQYKFDKHAEILYLLDQMRSN
ncbi:S41 family peptidase [Parabacteroides sp. PF5-6]|uniref:S41 family peptidase n=1 Tax=Parabacteroides sp. PF5-6 TaxID=1742403 RepID=UPI002406B4A0|nr:S41 family peptidase [Parabacteroides sp. PF5-6]